jgi:hypothetical protein
MGGVNSMLEVMRMTGFLVRPEDVRNPGDSQDTFVREERVVNCDGLACGTAVADEEGQPISFLPHDRHIVVSGISPLASPRYFAVPK